MKMKKHMMRESAGDQKPRKHFCLSPKALMIGFRFGVYSDYLDIDEIDAFEIEMRDTFSLACDDVDKATGLRNLAELDDCVINRFEFGSDPNHAIVLICPYDVLKDKMADDTDDDPDDIDDADVADEMEKRMKAAGFKHLTHGEFAREYGVRG